MRTRKEILFDLIFFKDNLKKLIKELRQYSWDCEDNLVTLNKNNIIYVFNKVILKKIKINELEDWANIIEGRDDIGYEDDDIKQLIIDVANPVLYGELNEDYVKGIIKRLESPVVRSARSKEKDQE